MDTLGKYIFLTLFVGTTFDVGTSLFALYVQALCVYVMYVCVYVCMYVCMYIQTIDLYFM